jgi:hypothetical protein
MKNEEYIVKNVETQEPIFFGKIQGLTYDKNKKQITITFDISEYISDEYNVNITYDKIKNISNKNITKETNWRDDYKKYKDSQK